MVNSELTLEEYRTICVLAGKESQKYFDRGVVLSGLFGISFLSVKDVLWSNLSVTPLFFAVWVSFVLSVLLMIASFYLSRKTCDCVVAAIDKGTDPNTELNGSYAKMTVVVTVLSWVSLVVGFAGTTMILWVGL